MTEQFTAFVSAALMVIACSATPSELVMKLNQQINTALQTPEVRECFSKMGVEPAGGTPQELAKVLASDVRRWTKVVADAGIPRE